MKHPLLTTTVVALVLSLSAVCHALLIWMPDGTKAEAQIVGNRLMLLDKTGKMIPAPDGTYKTDAGKVIVVQGGVLAPPPPPVGGAEAKVVRIDQLSSKAQFKALADDTIIDVGGKRMRKAELVADFKRRATPESVGAAIRPAGLAAIQAQLIDKENAAIAASDAEVRRRLEEMRKQGGDQ